MTQNNQDIDRESVLELRSRIYELGSSLEDKGVIEMFYMELLPEQIVPRLEKITGLDQHQLKKSAAYHALIGSTVPKEMPIDLTGGKIIEFFRYLIKILEEAEKTGKIIFE